MAGKPLLLSKSSLIPFHWLNSSSHTLPLSLPPLLWVLTVFSSPVSSSLLVLPLCLVAAGEGGVLVAAMANATLSLSHISSALPAAVSGKSSFLSGCSSSNGARLLCASNGSKLSMSAEWLPGQPRPPYLDGSSPGDFGFDPLGLAELPENYERYKESELIHCRWAMLAVPGVLIPEALGLGNWVDAQKWAATPGGQATYLGVPVPWGTLPIILAVEFFAIAFVEAKRNEEPDPEKRKYPGGPFDPLGFSKDPAKFQEYKVKEIKNGRLALLAFVGFSVQAAAYPGTGPLENLFTHIADPWHKNIAEIVIPRSIL